jgi:hypothetical protein
MLAKNIWDTLSKIDVSEHIEKKVNLSYLSWAWAWATLMKHYPDAAYEFEMERFEDGTTEVRVVLAITQDDQTVMRHMWLPVMDHRNKPISNPDAFAINTAKMRCLVKCMAMFGLGHYIYAGEDLPEASNDTIDGDQYKTIMSLIEKTNSDMAKFLKAFNIESVEAMPQKSFQKALTALQRKVSNEGK